MEVRIENLCKSYGDQPVVRNITLRIPAHGLFFLLGPSGCGKTTLLRMLAGFLEADSGEIWFGDRKIRGVPAHERNTGMVFQNYALWPHMSVAENVAYGLEVRKLGRDEIHQRVGEALELVRMQTYAGRKPTQLSGGQQQRVALARALVIKPSLLLLDEPLSNLDARLRIEMREEIRRIHSETRITTVYVTHDQKEALSLAEQMAVMDRGVVAQVGGPRAVYRKPATQFVADFIGETNWLDGEVRGRADGHLEIGTELGVWKCMEAGDSAPGRKVRIGFRPETVRFGAAELNEFKAELLQMNYLGEIEEYRLKTENKIEIKAFEQNPEQARHIGTVVVAHVRPEDTIVLPREG